MNSANICNELNTSLSVLFQCRVREHDVMVRTPFLYPDGDYIDLFVDMVEGTGLISDFGETIRWLRSQTLSPRRTPKQNQMIQDIALTHGVEFYKGMLQARVHTSGDFAGVLVRVAQASLRVSDLWLTFRTRAIQSMADEVEDFLREGHLDFSRNERLVGRSGKNWHLDFHVRTPEQSSLVLVLTTGSRSASRSVSNEAVATWYDLSQLKVGPEAVRFVSLFDDSADIWSVEDFKLVEDLSTIARWSAPDQFAETLTAAAP